MRFTIRTIAITMLILAVTAAGSLAAKATKIGLIDFQRVLDISNAGKAAQARINKEGKQMEDDLKAKGAEIEQMRQRLEQEKMVSSKEALDERGRELRIRINDFKTLQQRYTQQARKLQFKEMEAIKKAVFDIASEIGKKEDYQLIVERQESGVIYYPAAIDLTDRLVEEYDARYAKKAEPKK